MLYYENDGENIKEEDDKVEERLAKKEWPRE